MGFMRNKVWNYPRQIQFVYTTFGLSCFFSQSRTGSQSPQNIKWNIWKVLQDVRNWKMVFQEKPKLKITEYRVYSIGTKPNQREANETKRCQYCLERFPWYIRGYVEQLYAVQLAITNFGICIYMIVASFPCTLTTSQDRP
jgi:hypothetical protein